MVTDGGIRPTDKDLYYIYIIKKKTDTVSSSGVASLFLSEGAANVHRTSDMFYSHGGLAPFLFTS